MHTQRGRQLVCLCPLRIAKVVFVIFETQLPCLPGAWVVTRSNAANAWSVCLASGSRSLSTGALSSGAQAMTWQWHGLVLHCAWTRHSRREGGGGAETRPII